MSSNTLKELFSYPNVEETTPKDEEKKKAYEILESSPMFQLSLASKELFHSNFLAWIGSWKVDKGPRHPFRQLMFKLGAKHALEPDSWGKDWYVAREYKNFDLCVLDCEPEDLDESEESEDLEERVKKQAHVLLVLENKVKSIPYIEQLHEYQDKILDINFDWIKKKDQDPKYKWQLSEQGANKHNILDPAEYVANKKKGAIKDLKDNNTDFLLLSMSKSFPDEQIINNESIWCLKSYSDYSNELSRIIESFAEASLSRSIIKDYNSQLVSLLQLHKEWTEGDFEEREFLYYSRMKDGGRSYRFDYPKLKQLRIHDLFQKQRYAKMCSILRQKIETNIIGRFQLESVSRLDLTKDKLKKKVLVGFNFLHGEPLLDIWLGTEDFVYTIQIQGDSYEHGIQMKLDAGQKKGDNSKKLWNRLWEEDNAIAKSVSGWNWICPFKDPFNKDGSILKGQYFPILNLKESIFEEDDIVYPTNPRKRGKDYYPFLKYEMDTGVTFIYQYRKVSDKAKVKQVLDYIVADLQALCEKLY